MGFALMLYRKYLANYNTANRTLKLLGEDKKFQAWLLDTEAKNAEQLSGTSLSSLLIQPVQRIPRYRMLLEELLKQYSKVATAEQEGVEDSRGRVSRAVLETTEAGARAFLSASYTPRICIWCTLQ
jgi:hypothetical protein